MDTQRQQDLWAIAGENYQAAVLTAQQGWHNVSVACSYYAVFTAIWVALGDPPRGTGSTAVLWTGLPVETGDFHQHQLSES